MLYRRFEKGNMDVSLLGLGCMRFPMDGRGNVDEAKAIEMIRTSIDEGVNYIDTAIHISRRAQREDHSQSP